MSVTRSSIGWLVLSLLVVAVMVLPLIGVAAGIFTPANSTWQHIVDNLLLDYVVNTTVLVALSLFGGIIVASLLAWFVTAYDFPGRKFLSVGLVLPLAIPPYIGGYTYVSMLSYTGPIQVFAREKLGITLPPGFGDIQSLPGAAAIFVLFLYPYIFLVVRAFLDRQAGQLVEAARMLGANHMATYFRVIAPLTRNAVVAGATLMAFEVLSDYGVVSYFGVQVFTTAIFKAWLGLNDMASALRLAGMLLLVVTVVIFVEKSTRGRASFAYSSPKIQPLKRIRPRGGAKVFIPFFCWAVFAVALIIPVVQMVVWAILSLDNIRYSALLAAVQSTVLVAACAALIATVAAFIVAQHQRLWPSKLSRTLARITILGYSVPSTVIAMSVLSLVVWVSTAAGAPLMLTPAIVVLAYVMRYLAVAMQSIETGCERIGVRYHQAGRLLGHSPLSCSVKIDIPMMKTAVIGAFLLAFIDMVKELPMVLILRPFNFTTLSTVVFQYANDEQIPESALPSLLIVALAFIPVALLVARDSQSAEKAKDF